MAKITLKNSLIVSLLVLLLNSVSAAHYIVGYVGDALDGEPADGHTIALWNPSRGISDNLTAVIGPSGSSGASGYYMFDCEMLSRPCNVGDSINLKGLNLGDNYLTSQISLTVSGYGYDSAENLKLNSPPSVVLNLPLDESNISTGEVAFNCTAQDVDSNLADITLYGSWSGGWHVNETQLTLNSSSNSLFVKNISEGIYKWNCLASDDLGITSFSSKNYSFAVDLTAPSIKRIGINTSNTCGLPNKVLVNCSANDTTTGVKTVKIEVVSPSASTNITADWLGGEEYSKELRIDEYGDWHFRCISIDYVNNTNYSQFLSAKAATQEPDLKLFNRYFQILKNPIIENESIAFNLTLFNDGCTNAQNFNVSFFETNILFGKNQIGNNYTISINALSNLTISGTWYARIGKTLLEAIADPDNLIAELNETDNEAQQSAEITSWQSLYGNVTFDRLIASASSQDLRKWGAPSANTSLFVTDRESAIHWTSLQALGKNKTGQDSSSDLEEADVLLNMTNLTDSMSVLFNNSQRVSFTVKGKIIENVLTINSTNNSVFITGVLWDYSRDTNGEFDLGDKEDLVFVTQAKDAIQGAYGRYNYEIKIPVKLRDFHSEDSSRVYIYVELS